MYGGARTATTDASGVVMHALLCLSSYGFFATPGGRGMNRVEICRAFQVQVCGVVDRVWLTLKCTEETATREQFRLWLPYKRRERVTWSVVAIGVGSRLLWRAC